MRELGHRWVFGAVAVAYAALVLLSLTGIVIFLLLSFVSHLLLHKWHESALKREN